MAQLWERFVFEVPGRRPARRKRTSDCEDASTGLPSQRGAAFPRASSIHHRLPVLSHCPSASQGSVIDVFRCVYLEQIPVDFTHSLHA
jgi:hypothetical protein